MIVENVKVFMEESGFVPGKVIIEEGKIKEICLKDESFLQQQKKQPGEKKAEYLDGAGNYLIPGMIDIHLHGCQGFDFCDGTFEAVEGISRYQASIGVTTIAAATMTLPVNTLCRVLEQCARFCEERAQGKYEYCAQLAGINMEGPFISEAKRGAQTLDYISKPETELYHRFQKSAGGLVKYVGVAPEIQGAIEFVEEIKDEVKVTLAHSNADYDRAKAAFKAGACHVTHLYNGMPEFRHRNPGIVGAVYDEKHVEAELICDGLHVHPSVIRATFDMLGHERILLVSDSIRATGMIPGEYELGGQKVTVTEKSAVISGTDILAGSITTLPEALRYAVQVVGIELETALMCVTRNPAVSLGIYEECGSISVGKRADLVLLDEELRVQKVIKDGKILK